MIFTRSTKQAGVALMMTIWILVLLSVMAGQFAQTMRLEMQISKNYKDQVQLYYLALAAMEVAIAEILAPYRVTTLAANGEIIFIRDNSDLPNLNQGSQASFTDMWNQIGAQDTEAFKTALNSFIGHRSQFKLEDAVLSYSVTDEDGKFNINSLIVRNQVRQHNVDVFRKLLIATGIEDGMPADIIVDSVLDWLDEDDLHRGNGAEDDWYKENYRDQGMMRPYKPKNGPLSSLEELLLVRGITPAILYGSSAVPKLPTEDEKEKTSYQGLFQHLTVFTPASLSAQNINRNTASDLLLSIIFPDNAEELVTRRRESGILAARSASRYFTVQASAYLPHSDVSRTIKAVLFKTNPQRSSRIQIKYWKDNARYQKPGENFFLDFENGNPIIPTR